MRRACVALAVIALTNGALGDTMADIDYADLDGGAKSVDESVAALLQSELAAFLSPDVRDTTGVCVATSERAGWKADAVDRDK